MYKHRLGEALKENNISQSQLAKMVEMPPQTIYKYVNFKRSMTIENLVKISKALNVSTDYLLGLSDHKDIR